MGGIMSNVQIGSGSGGSNSGDGFPTFKIILYIGIIVLICKSIVFSRGYDEQM